jgi:hypothetical protein
LLSYSEVIAVNAMLLPAFQIHQSAIDYQLRILEQALCDPAVHPEASFFVKSVV